MLKIKAQSKYIDLSKSIRIYYLLAIGIFITILSFALYRDLLSTLVLGLCTAAAFFIFQKPPSEITVEANDTNIKVDHDRFDWSKVIEWSMVDLGEKVEIILRTDNTSSFFDIFSIGSFHYFYIDPELESFAELVKLISLNAAYSEELPQKDVVHIGLRILGLV